MNSTQTKQENTWEKKKKMCGEKKNNNFTLQTIELNPEGDTAVNHLWECDHSAAHTDLF